MSREKLQFTVDFLGGQSATARLLRAAVPGSRVQQGHVRRWLFVVKGPVPPGEYVIPLARLTDWTVLPHDLRPDLYPYVKDGVPPDVIGAARAVLK